MATHRPAVSAATKAALVAEAGNKCANPGCVGFRTHLHHIAAWAIYETHDQSTMIAICPSCHDAVHHGELPIDDDTLLAWKAIVRLQTRPRDLVYVEPGDKTKLVLGGVSVYGNSGGLRVLNLAPSTHLSYRLVDDDVVLVNLAVSTVDGREVLRVVDGHMRVETG